MSTRTSRSVIIVGAGVAGLAAGCYAQMNGYRSQILEAHDKPGGLCTAWTRQGYTFDGCIHHLAGSGPESKLYRIWEELGGLGTEEVVFHEDLVHVEAPDGRALTVYTNIDRLAQHMKELAPADSSTIDEYTRAARFYTHFDLFALPIANSWETLRTLALAPSLIKWGKVTMDQYAARFRDPFLRQAFPTIQYDTPGLPLAVHLNFLACCHNRTLGWPAGGSLAFARAIERRYCDLGGEVHYRSRVAKILTQDGQARGVGLVDGTEIYCDVVISAADGHATIFDMLDGQHADERIRTYYEGAPSASTMNLTVCLGVSRDMRDQPHALTYFLEKPLSVSGKTHDRLDMEVFNFDPTLAPAGKTPIKVTLEASYARWKELATDRARYKEEKQQIAARVIERLDDRFPGLARQVEVADVATPLTVERYTGNWRGLQAWPPAGSILRTMAKGFTRTLPGLGSFYMAGQWGEGMPGISTVAIAGRNVVKMLCKRDGKRFVTWPGPRR